MIRRLGTFTLWTGTLLCVLIAVAFVVSGWWMLTLQIPTDGPRVGVIAGSFFVLADRQWTAGFHALSLSSAQLPFDSPGWGRWNAWMMDAPRAFIGISAPLYALFFAVAIPTLLVWRFWPKPVRPGHCRCGYDLRGNMSGTCPECGVEMQV